MEQPTGQGPPDGFIPLGTKDRSGQLTHDFRTALVTLLSNLRLIILLGLMATLSAFSVLHFGLQDYRLHSLQKGRDRQCEIHPNRISILGSRTGRRYTYGFQFGVPSER